MALVVFAAAYCSREFIQNLFTKLIRDERTKFKADKER